VYQGDQVILDVTATHAVKTEYGYQVGFDRLLAIRQVQAPSWTGVVVTGPHDWHCAWDCEPLRRRLRKRYVPTAWGQITGDTGVVPGFVWRLLSTTSLLAVPHGARYYDPELGRFLSEIRSVSPAASTCTPTLATIQSTGLIAADSTNAHRRPRPWRVPRIRSLSPVVVCGDQGDGTPGPPPACAYFDTCGGNPPSFPPPDEPELPDLSAARWGVPRRQCRTVNR